MASTPIRRSQLIARRPRELRSNARVDAAPSTPDSTRTRPTSAAAKKKQAAQAKKLREAEAKAAKEADVHARTAAIMAAQPEDEDDEGPHPQATTQPPVDEAIDPALAAIGSAFMQEADSRPGLPAPVHNEDYMDTFSDDDSNDQAGGGGGVMFDGAPFADFDADVVNATPTGGKRKRGVASRSNIPDDARIPANKRVAGAPGDEPLHGTKVVSAEFDGDQKVFGRHAKLMMRESIIVRNSYPNPYDQHADFLRLAQHVAESSRFACDAHVRVLNELRTDHHLCERMMRWVDYGAQACRATCVGLTRKAYHLTGMPLNGKDAREGQQKTMEVSHWMSQTGAWAFGDINVIGKTFDPLTFGQGEIVVKVTANYLIIQRSRLDTEVFSKVMELQEVPNSFMALIMTCKAHITDEYSGGRWERKPFTLASATTYHDLIAKLQSYEFDYPHLVKEWRSKLFHAACEKAQKSWLIRQEMPEDAPAVKDAFREAEEAASKRAGI